MTRTSPDGDGANQHPASRRQRKAARGPVRPARSARRRSARGGRTGGATGFRWHRCLRDDTRRRGLAAALPVAPARRRASATPGPRHSRRRAPRLADGAPAGAAGPCRLLQVPYASAASTSITTTINHGRRLWVSSPAVSHERSGLALEPSPRRGCRTPTRARGPCVRSVVDGSRRRARNCIMNGSASGSTASFRPGRRPPAIPVRPRVAAARRACVSAPALPISTTGLSIVPSSSGNSDSATPSGSTMAGP